MESSIGNRERTAVEFGCVKDLGRLEQKKQQRAAKVAVLVAVCLAVAKVVAGALVNSAAVLASAVDSLLDVFASTVNLVAIRISHAPPDHDHRWGHAKAEAVATAGQGLLIGGSAAYLFVEGARRVFAPEAYRTPSIGMAVMGGSALASAILVAYMKRVARRTQSTALLADATHYQTDVLSNLAVLAGVAVTAVTRFGRLDGILTIGVSIYVGSSAFRLLRGAIVILMDREIDAADRAEVEAVIDGFRDRLRGYHGLRTRMAGPSVFIEVHLEMDGSMPLESAHDLGVEVERAIKRTRPNAEVLIHLDVEDDDPKLAAH